MFKKAFKRITGRSLKKKPSSKKKVVKPVKTPLKKIATPSKKLGALKKQSLVKAPAPGKILTAEGWKRLMLESYKTDRHLA